jgi:hypothetical protein
MAKESALENAVIDFLSYLGISARKMYSYRDHGRDEKGIEISSHPISDGASPYIIGSIDGLIIAISLKNKPNDKFLQRVKSTGGIAFVATSVKDVAGELAKYWPESLTQNH